MESCVLQYLTHARYVRTLQIRVFIENNSKIFNITRAKASVNICKINNQAEYRNNIRIYLHKCSVLFSYHVSGRSKIIPAYNKIDNITNPYLHSLFEVADKNTGRINPALSLGEIFCLNFTPSTMHKLVFLRI